MSEGPIPEIIFPGKQFDNEFVADFRFRLRRVPVPPLGGTEQRAVLMFAFLL